MDIIRLVVLIWLILPIPMYWLVRRWYHAQTRNYPHTTAGRIIDVAYSDSGEYDWNGVTNVTYAFSVAGIEYRGTATLLGKNHTPGEEIRVRYNAEKPAQSRRDDLPDRIKTWVILGTLGLAIDLGFCVFGIYCGLLLFFAGIILLIQRRMQWQQFAPSAPIFTSIMFIVLGLPLVALGVFGLIVVGFPGQNILWALWNHLPLFPG